MVAECAENATKPVDDIPVGTPKELLDDFEDLFKPTAKYLNQPGTPLYNHFSDHKDALKSVIRPLQKDGQGGPSGTKFATPEVPNYMQVFEMMKQKDKDAKDAVKLWVANNYLAAKAAKYALRRSALKAKQVLGNDAWRLLPALDEIRMGGLRQKLYTDAWTLKETENTDPGVSKPTEVTSLLKDARVLVSSDWNKNGAHAKTNVEPARAQNHYGTITGLEQKYHKGHTKPTWSILLDRIPGDDKIASTIDAYVNEFQLSPPKA